MGFVVICGAAGGLNPAMAEFITLCAFSCFTFLTVLNIPFYDPVTGGGVKNMARFLILVIIIMIRPYGSSGKEISERVWRLSENAPSAVPGSRGAGQG